MQEEVKKYFREYQAKRRLNPEIRERLNKYQRDYQRKRRLNDPHFKTDQYLRNLAYQRRKEEIDPDWKKKLNAKIRDSNRLKKFGITPEQYQEILLKHNGVCFSCHKTNKGNVQLLINFDLVTNTVRCLLCRSCNFWRMKYGWKAMVAKYGAKKDNIILA